MSLNFFCLVAPAYQKAAEEELQQEKDTQRRQAGVPLEWLAEVPLERQEKVPLESLAEAQQLVQVQVQQ